MPRLAGARYGDPAPHPTICSGLARMFLWRRDALAAEITSVTRRGRRVSKSQAVRRFAFEHGRLALAAELAGVELVVVTVAAQQFLGACRSPRLDRG